MCAVLQQSKSIVALFNFPLILTIQDFQIPINFDFHLHRRLSSRFQVDAREGNELFSGPRDGRHALEKVHLGHEAPGQGSVVLNINEERYGVCGGEGGAVP